MRAREIYHSCLNLHYKSLPFKPKAMEQYKTQQIVIQKNSIRIEMALLKLDQSPFPLYLYSFISSVHLLR